MKEGDWDGLGDEDPNRFYISIFDFLMGKHLKILKTTLFLIQETIQIFFPNDVKIAKVI